MAFLTKILIRVCGILLLGSSVQAQSSFEYELKAAFLFRFTEFIEWPAGAFPSPQAPIRICVFGKDPFANALDQTLSGERVGGRALMAVRPDSVSELPNCHVVFIGQSERPRMIEILTDLRGKPVLTVADTPGFLDNGGMVNFVIEGGRVRFDINLAATETARLRMSSKLLRSARLVQRRSRG